MANFNKVIIAGRLGKDPEVRQIGETKVVSFSVATSERFTKNGEQQEHTDWHNVEAWGKTADFVEKYFKKGSLILIDGKIKYDSYTDKDGNNRISTKIRANTVDFVGSKQPDSESNKQNATITKPVSSSNTESDLPF